MSTPTLEEVREALDLVAETGGAAPFWRRASRLVDEYATAHNITRGEAKRRALYQLERNP